MELLKAATDLRLWLALAIVLSFLVPESDLPFSTLIIVILMIQMTLSMDGLRLSIQDLGTNRKGALISIFMSYVVNTGITLLLGSFFIPDNKEIWYGWVMLASMPCAIAVVTAAILTNENMETSVLAVTATYLSGLVLTPLLSYALIGDAVNPLEILKYIVLFILIPVILSRFTPRLRMKRSFKVPVINLMMAAMVFCSVNSNRGTMVDDPMFIRLILAVVLLRVLVLNAVVWLMIRRWGFARGSESTYLVLGVWKNTGLSISMTMVLLAATPTSVIPCFLSMIVETLWFSVVTRERKAVQTPDAVPDEG